jgi:predicted Zn finger-like uncharacterized protein
MILTCPSCSASYNVPNEAIGLDGRAVRCKKCKHEWFQDGEKKALEDLINMVEATDINLDALSFGDNKKSALARQAKTKVKLSVRMVAILDKIIPAPLKNYLLSGDKRSFLSHFASFMVALAVFSFLCLVLVTGRWGITHVFPSLASVYEAAGFPLTSYARLNPESSLIIDRVAFQDEDKKREIIGSLINLTSQNVKVPSFKVSYLDEKGTVLQESVQNLPITMIQKELAFSFSLPVPKSVPPNFSAVKISFTEPTK